MIFLLLENVLVLFVTVLIKGVVSATKCSSVKSEVIDVTIREPPPKITFPPETTSSIKCAVLSGFTPKMPPHVKS